MKIYAVGGSVRDQLLGLPVSDRDYVVVGATPQQMINAGYRPVGADFPVFLHPTTHEEYALARTERKTAPGYKGFVFHTDAGVRLEEDLRRRDLTINAIAQCEDQSLIDPYGGRADIDRRMLRHVSDAFAEDPVRILRVARFAARFASLGFTVADETVALMRRMVDAGEVDHLVPERVWQELSRGLMEATPSRMFAVLRACGALQRLLPEVDRLFGVPQAPKPHPEIDTGVHVMMVIDCAASLGYALPVRFAALSHDLGKGLTSPASWPQHPRHEEVGARLVDQIGERLRVPADCRDLARMVARWHGEAHQAPVLPPARWLALLDGCDALRRPERFVEFVDACACDHYGRTGFADKPYASRNLLIGALAALQSLDFGAIAAGARASGENIADAVARHKLEKLQQLSLERKAT
jgi:tRNA nucleotidyltransferase (CCA-adding enzyme)